MLEITDATTVPMLKEYAEQNNIDLGKAKKRQEIIDIIQAATATPTPSVEGEDVAGGADTPPEEETGTEGEENATGEDETGDEETNDTPPEEDDEKEEATPDPSEEETTTGDTDTTEGTSPEDNDDETAGNVIDRLLQASRLLIKGTDVDAVHARLEQKGINVGTDKQGGIYGAKTAYAVRVFQARNRLIVDGKVGKFTATALGFEWKGYTGINFETVIAISYVLG